MPSTPGFLVYLANKSCFYSLEQEAPAASLLEFIVSLTTFGVGFLLVFWDNIQPARRLACLQIHSFIHIVNSSIILWTLMYQEMKLGTSVNSYQNFNVQVYLFFYHYCILTCFSAGGNWCKSVLDTLTGWPVSLGKNIFRKAFKEKDRNRETEQHRTGQDTPNWAWQRYRDTWGHCHLEGDVTKSTMREEKSREDGESHKIIHICPQKFAKVGRATPLFVQVPDMEW